MQRVFVLSKNKIPLMPCHLAKSRKLIKTEKAALYLFHSFSTILLQKKARKTQKLQLKFDPGSRLTGIALILFRQKKMQLVWAANLEHRGAVVKKNLLNKRGLRHTRYRKPRFLNRTSKKRWLTPSLQSKVDNITSWANKIKDLSPVSDVMVETVRFDMQKLQNPEVSGFTYQQGAFFGHEVRKHLLEKWQRACAYCDKKDVPLEIDPIIPRSQRRSDRVSNLSLSYRKHNEKKGSQKRALTGAKTPIKDAAAINSIRYEIGNRLKAFSLPIEFASGGQTKYNRTQNDLPKDHWIDVACVGKEGEDISISPQMLPLHIKAVKRDSRQMCLPDKYSFPRTKAKAQKIVKGFKTGDFVKAVVPKGKNKGTHFEMVGVRLTGSFYLRTPTSKGDGLNAKHCTLAQKSLGYTFSFKKEKIALPSPAKARGIRALGVL